MVAEAPRVREKSRLNGLIDLVDAVAPAGFPIQTGQTIAMPYTLALGNSYTPLSLNRILLSYSFMSQGLIQTVVKQPVEDAFRGGFDIVSKELSEEEVTKLKNTLKRPRRQEGRRGSRFQRNMNPQAATNPAHSDIRVMMDVLNWSRLFGGAGLIVNTDQSFHTELKIDKIRQDSPLEFIAADRWELILSQTDVFDERNPTPFNYYGLPLHRSRVVKVLGVEAPSYIRQRLQGWGMSEIERCIRAINSFVKFENLIFELLDEAKIDVFKITGFNDNLLTDEGTDNVKKRVTLANRLKNFQNALAMDAEDDYAQKQITWSGLAEIWNELRMNLSSALKIPMNKLFGQSATGFGGGEDALENYNSIVEQVRSDAEPVAIEVIDLRCQQLFGFVPEYTLAWKPLKVLDGVQEEQVKTSKQKRATDLFQMRLTTGREASTILRQDGLLNIDTEVSQGLREVEPTNPNEGDPSDKAIEADAATAKAATKPKPAPAAGKK